MEDAALYYAQMATEKSIILSQLNLKEKKFILATIHRAENTDNTMNLKNIIEVFNHISEDYDIVVPLHPRTKWIIEQQRLKTKFTIIDPVGYFDIIMLLQNCSLVTTDSGGLQKEAFFFRKYCITTREQTEWVELVENGYNFIAGTSKDLIINKTPELLTKDFPVAINLYGNGEVCKNICQSLIK